ncbi:hypothetical protein [Sphingomonas sp.]|uniref:hypothetical protein n=1 Tax=Sphingomonas sp. TaxID=28214 RepID=UPI003B004448
MSAAEKLDERLPFWPVAMARPMALAYTGVSEAQMRAWEKTGLVHFRTRGPHGAAIVQRAELDMAVADLFSRDLSEDLDFGD